MPNAPSPYAKRAARDDLFDPPRLPRQPHEAYFRCLWCTRWKVWRPLALCDECQARYEEAAVGMPQATTKELEFGSHG